jgi:hypothetical protein
MRGSRTPESENMVMNHTDNADYLAKIQRAADGEVQGEVLFKCLAAKAEQEHRHKLERLAELEIRTGREMDALMARYGLTLSSENVGRAEERAKRYDGMSYRDILEEWSTWIPSFVDLYDRLAESARPDDKAALDFLAEHERAIDAFITHELAGRPEQALLQLDRLLEA